MKSIIIASCLSLIVAGTAVQPRITDVEPTTPAVGPTAQLVTVTGDDFRTGLTLEVTTPGGDIRNVIGRDIQSRRETSFQVWLAFDAPGTYSFVVLNDDGLRSNALAIQARRVATLPVIDHVTPEEPLKDAQPQTVTITGRNFALGLRVSVTDPTGTVTVAEQIDRTDAHTIVLPLVLDISGQYALMVTNPSGDSSNTVTVTVR